MTLEVMVDTTGEIPTPLLHYDATDLDEAVTSGSKDKKCRVCGDRALGYNFNAVTCESCKAFFRRNAVKTKDFRCPYVGSCDITPVTRKFCQKCRLRKCFNVGMIKDWILSDEARVARRFPHTRDKSISEDGPPVRKKTKLSGSGVKLEASTNTAVRPSIIADGSGGSVPSVQSESSASSSSPVSPREIVGSSDVKSSYTVNSPFPSAGLDANGQLLSERRYSSAFTTFPNQNAPLTIQSNYTTEVINLMNANSGVASPRQHTVGSAVKSGNPLSTNLVYLDSNWPQNNFPGNMFLGRPSSSGGISGSIQDLHAACAILESVSGSTKVDEVGLKSSMTSPFDATSTISKDVLIQLLNQCGGMLAKQGVRVSVEAEGIGTSFIPARPRCVCQCSCSASLGKPLFPDQQEKCVDTADLHDCFNETPDFRCSSRSSAITPNYSTGQSQSLLCNGMLPSGQMVDISGGSSNGVNHSMSGIISSLVGNLSHEQQRFLASQEAGSESILNGFGVSDCLYNVLDQAIATEFQQPNPDQEHASALAQVSNVGQHEGFVNTIPSPPGLSHLTPDEQTLMDELTDANEVMKEPMERLVGKSEHATRLIDVINLTDIGIKRVIKMSKRVQVFKSLGEEDQIALLKGGCTEIMIMRGVMSYDPEKDSWHGPASHYIKCEILKQAKGRNVYEEHKRYIQSFNNEWRQNEAVMLLLGAIVLFTPSRPRIANREIIRKLQNSYYNLLHRYLETLYSTSNARIAYSNLVQKIEQLHQLNEKALAIFAEVNPKEVEPLLVEIFDLK